MNTAQIPLINIAPPAEGMQNVIPANFFWVTGMRFLYFKKCQDFQDNTNTTSLPELSIWRKKNHHLPIVCISYICLSLLLEIVSSKAATIQWCFEWVSVFAFDDVQSLEIAFTSLSSNLLFQFKSFAVRSIVFKYKELSNARWERASKSYTLDLYHKHLHYLDRRCTIISCKQIELTSNASSGTWQTRTCSMEKHRQLLAVVSLSITEGETKIACRLVGANMTQKDVIHTCMVACASLLLDYCSNHYY